MWFLFFKYIFSYKHTKGLKWKNQTINDYCWVIEFQVISMKFLRWICITSKIRRNRKRFLKDGVYDVIRYRRASELRGLNGLSVFSFSFFWLCLAACGILVPWPSIDPGSEISKSQPRITGNSQARLALTLVSWAVLPTLVNITALLAPRCSKGNFCCSSGYSFRSVQSLSRVRLFATPWIAARQASLSITNSRSLSKPMSIKSVMPSSHLILCHPLLPPSIFPSIRVFSNESILDSSL